MSIERGAGRDFSHVAERWKDAYYRNGSWTRTVGGDSQITYDALVALGKNASPDDIDGVIGNRSWTSTTCVECEKYYRSGWTIGQPPDYESSTIHICDACARKMANTILRTLRKEASK